MDNRSRYFQAVAGRFFKHRGAPFYVSPKDMAQIETWERMGIPLRIVQEGIDSFFESGRKRPGRRAARATLVHCHSHVLRFFEALRERRVGSGCDRRDVPLRARNRAETLDVFIRKTPAGLESLRPIYSEALHILEREPSSEDRLEALDEKAEELIWGCVPGAEKQAALRRAALDLPDAASAERERITRIRLIKKMREKHRIPYIASFYY